MERGILQLCSAQGFMFRVFRFRRLHGEILLGAECVPERLSSLYVAGKRRYDRKQSGYGGQTKPVFHKKVCEVFVSTLELYMSPVSFFCWEGNLIFLRLELLPGLYFTCDQ
jgi:hypothetical protein